MISIITIINYYFDTCWFSNERQRVQIWVGVELGRIWKE